MIEVYHGYPLTRGFRQSQYNLDVNSLGNNIIITKITFDRSF